MVNIVSVHCCAFQWNTQINKWLTLGWKRGILTVTAPVSWVSQKPPKISILHLHQLIKFSLTPWPGQICSLFSILQMRELGNRRMLVIYRGLNASSVMADPKQRQIRLLCFPASEKHKGDPLRRKRGSVKAFLQRPLNQYLQTSCSGIKAPW